MTTKAIPLEDFMQDNWEAFSGLENDAEKLLTSMSRKLPAGYYEQMRDDFFDFLISCGLAGKLMIRAVVDSNIIIGDSINVAKGRVSTTERVFESPFVEYLSPSEIKDEVMRNLRERFPDNAKYDIASKQANRLLAHIDTKSCESVAAVTKAKQLLAGHSKDVPFLAMYFETDADAIISHEIGTYEKPGVRRWRLGEAVDVVVAYESGSLAFVIAGETIKALLEAFESILMMILRALVEAMEVIIDLLRNLAEGIADAISKLPDWAKAALAIIGGIAAIIAIFHEGAKKWIAEKAKEIGDVLSQLITTLWHGLKDLLVLIWNIMLPITGSAVVLGGVLLRRIINAIILSQKLATESST